MKLKKFIILLMCVIFVITLSAPVGAADTVADMEKKLAQNKDKIKEINDKLSSLKKEQGSVQTEIQKLDLQMDNLNAEIDGYEIEISSLNSQITQKQEEVVNLTKDIDYNNEMLEDRLRVMYKNGVSGYIEVIFNAEDLIDALTRLDMIQLIVQSDVDLLKTIETQKKEVETIQAEMESERNQIAVVKGNVQSKKQEVERQWREKEKYMTALQSDIKESQAMEARMEKAAKELESQILAKQREVEYAGGQMAWPSPGYYNITSRFGRRVHPINGGMSNHGAMDISVPYGSKVVAANDGVVMFAGSHWSYGNYVVIDHGGKISTLYAHNSRLTVSAGQTVKRGELIAYSGSTGESTGPHVHFEVRINGVRVDPEPYVK